MASNRVRRSSRAPSSHSLISSEAVVWEQNATAQPVVTPESLMARRRLSVRSRKVRRPSASACTVVVVAFTPPPSGSSANGRLGPVRNRRRGIRRGQREEEPERGPAARAALHPDPSSVSLHHRSGDGQPDPGPPIVPRSGGVYPIEA